jgi:lipoprotein-anchoring transpeptidase ErfK/SrfK
MVLDSQTARGRQSRSKMTARRKRRPWLPLLIITVVAAGSWYLWGRSSTSAEQTPPAYVQSPDEPVVVLPRQTTPAPPTPRPQLTPPQPPAPPVTPPAAAAPDPAPVAAIEPQTTATEQPVADPAHRDGLPTDDPAVGSDVGAMAWQDVLELIKDTDRMVEARRLLSEILIKRADTLSYGDEQVIRQGLTNINLQLVYSKKVDRDDPVAGWHTISSGDNLSKIARQYKVTHEFLAWINGMANPNQIFAGQKIKIIRGPFHAVVDKSDYRIDIYLVDPTDGQWLYVNSMPVGLGADDSTPVGRWIVAPKGKVPNPEWTDPRTGQVWDADDPGNPIGDYWISLEGYGEETADLRGYGIHGTTEPDSIGDQQSMGCVRLRDRDIEVVYKLLMEGESIVVIKP